MKNSIIMVVALCGFLCFTSVAQSDSVVADEPFFKDMRIGIAAKKFTGFYWVNGITLVTNETIFGAPLVSGVNITSSVFGSALTSDALPLHMFEIFSYYHFRSKKSLQPFAGLNFGGAFTNYKDPAFKRLQQAQTILAPEFGIDYKFKFPVHVAASFGYHILTGNGKKGLGLVYPLYGQIRVLYDW